MVKLLTSSKLPGGPKGSTEPLGPRPGTFCHSIGARSALLEKQRARSKGAKRTRAKRTPFIWVPPARSFGLLPKDASRRDCFRYTRRHSLSCLAALAESLTVTRGHFNRIDNA